MTNQGSGGFGSTGYNSNQIKTLCDTTQDMVPIEPPYNIWLSEHPFQKILNVQLETTGCHPTMGMVFNTTLHKDRIQLSDMVKSTPGAKLPRWRCTLKWAILLKVGDKHITNEEQVCQAVQDARQQQLPTIPLVFATVQYHGIHLMKGSLMLYYDQLNVIGQHITLDDAFTPLESDVGKFFTLKQLKQHPDWHLWRKARYKMLDSYQDQGMFSDPMPAPADANIHHMLWRYTIKMCGTRKAFFTLWRIRKARHYRLRPHFCE
jgi:hypothetical protein